MGKEKGNLDVFKLFYEDLSKDWERRRVFFNSPKRVTDYLTDLLSRAWALARKFINHGRDRDVGNGCEKDKD